VGLFDWLDPTREWPMVAGPAPDLNSSLLPFDSLRFGDPLTSARFLGRPEQFQWHSRSAKEYDLVYARKGLRLGFRGDRLGEIEYFIGPHASVLPAFAPARPRAPDGTRLTPDMDRDRIVAVFGEPDPKGSDDGCLQIHHGRVSSDFILDDAGRLETWVLYPDD
jgi:hypothetical protein